MRTIRECLDMVEDQGLKMNFLGMYEEKKELIVSVNIRCQL